MYLVFPKSDPRSNGEPFNPKRPWMFHGASCTVLNMRRYFHTNATVVKFKNSKNHATDIVSNQFLKDKKPGKETTNGSSRPQRRS